MQFLKHRYKGFILVFMAIFSFFSIFHATPTYADVVDLIEKETLKLSITPKANSSTKYKIVVTGYTKTQDISKVYFYLDSKKYTASLSKDKKEFSYNKEVELKTLPKKFKVEAIDKKKRKQSFQFDLAYNLINTANIKVEQIPFIKDKAVFYHVTGKVSDKKVKKVEISLGKSKYIVEAPLKKQKFDKYILGKMNETVHIKAIHENGSIQEIDIITIK